MKRKRPQGERWLDGFAVRIAPIFVTTALFTSSISSTAQVRSFGADISYWNCGSGSTGISQAYWNTAYGTGNCVFVFHRATRGGTTGVDQTAGFPGGSGLQTLSQRYDDPRFVQNVTRAVAAGMVIGPYHFGRPDVAGNTGTDEANHFLQMAGPWMRPGYLMPMYDMEAGSGSDTLAQFIVDFSDRLYAVMQIRPCIYINGNYSSILQSATTAHRDSIAKPRYYMPSAIGPAYPMLWDARYPTTYNEQTDNPKDSYAGFYGPWDDYGNANPWSFWQYNTTVSIPGFNAVDSSCDADISHGDIEYVRNYLVPAVWWNDTSGDWSVLANWNSGQTPTDPVTPSDQPTPYATGGLPTPRLPGDAGTGPTSGQYDTVILERTNANITVGVSTGSYSVRKLYNRETLNINGGSLTINYDPTYRADDSANVLHGGPISAQFSGPATLSAGALNVHTLQVDTNAVFTLSGGTLTFYTINLMPHASVPAKILVSGDTTINPLNNATATIAKGSGSGNSGLVDLNGGTRTLTIGNGTSFADVSINVPVTNGGLVKSGSGTLQLTAANTYAGGTTVNGGVLVVSNTTGSATGSGPVTVNSGTLMGPGTISGAVNVTATGTIVPNLSLGTLTLNNAPTLNGLVYTQINRNNGTPLAGKIVLTSGTLTYGANLKVDNVGAALTGGEVFTLFSAPAYSGGFVSSNLPSLSAGLNWYLGGLTVNGSIKVNRKPSISSTLSFTNNAPAVLQIPFSALTGNGTDPDGDALTVASISATTANGIVLTTNATSISYSNTASATDQFSYTLSDGHGATVSGVVTVMSIAAPALAQFAGAAVTNGSSLVLRYSANAGSTYFIDRSTNLPVWTTIFTNTPASSGIFEFVDDFHDIGSPVSPAFYRLEWAP
ncbi:MAG: GH25 family lysozyme [Limisphaerales bacterium]